MKTIKIASVLISILLLSGCASFFKEDPKLIGYVENDARTAITYYDNGVYITYYYDNGTLSRVTKDNIWKIQRNIK